jgi:hypothetical protein
MHEEVRAEPAVGLLHEAVDLVDGFVGCADDAEAGLVHPGDPLFERLSGGPEVRYSEDLLGVVRPDVQAVANVLDRLLLRLRDVHRTDEAPLGAVGDGVELVCSGFHDIPVMRERVEAALRCGPRRTSVVGARCGSPPSGGSPDKSAASSSAISKTVLTSSHSR